jgi:hypothetical protein
MAAPRDVTALLGDWSRGNRTALNQLLPLVYAELRRVAARQLRSERADHTLQPTALFTRCSSGSSINGRSMAESAHFLWCRREVMRRILVDHAVVTARANGARVRAVCQWMKRKT